MNGVLVRVLADTAVRASVAALLVAGVLASLRVRSSAVRHASWTAVTVAMLLMPALKYLTPAIDLPISRSALEWTAPSFAERPAAALGPVSMTSVAAEPAPADAPLQVDAPSGALVAGHADRASTAAVWLAVALFVYGLGAVAMLVPFLVGWWGAARLARAGEPITPPPACLAFADNRDTIDVRESQAIAVPVTVGLIRQTILLPAAWKHWPMEKLRAVLAHETAHLGRRDLAVAFIAHLNRIAFWFHPLSWWLARTLAVAAEQAADDRAMSVVGDRAAYAGVLLDMARAVARERGRTAWPGVGIGGSGRLERRIERALHRDVPLACSPVRRIIVAVSCAGAILVAVVCRPSAAPFSEDAALEQRDRTLHVQLSQVERRQWRHFADLDWDAESQALGAREAALEQHPDDLAVLQQFLISYWAQYACKPVAHCGNPLVTNTVVDARLLETRRASVLSLIEHHPDADLAGFVEAQIFSKDVPDFFPGDAIGHAQARAAWMAIIERPDTSAPVLGHAASFFEIADPPLAERLLLRARALDPDGPWTARLGRFYQVVLTGSRVPAGPNSLRRLSEGEPRTAYGHAVRATLGESNDVALLTAAGWFLSHATSGPLLDFDPQEWAEACLSRALQIDPQAVLAHTALLDVRSRFRNHDPLYRIAPVSLDAAVAALPDRPRFERLPGLAREAWGRVADFDRWHDENLRGRLELGHAQAKRYSEEALRLAPKFRDDPDYGTAIYTANMTLSALALHDGDRKASLVYLERASQAPSSEELAYGGSVIWHRLIGDLVAQGEREGAIAFLERMARTNIANRIELRQWAAALRP